jgi:ATPase family associated with various cellular activities (AAA)
MGDLAQSIVALARAGERRRQGAGDLIESTSVVAKAIRQQLRNGDEVVVGRWLSEARTASPVRDLSDLRGVDEAGLAVFQQAVDDLRTRSPLTEGLLLTGVPGTGKFLVPTLIAKEAGVDLVALDPSSHDLADVIAAARAKAPCVLCVQEVEPSGDVMRHLVSEMGSLAQAGVLVVVGTTGLEDIDPGLFGSGRFSRRVALSGGGPSYRASAARLSDGTRHDVLTRDAAVLDAEVRGPWTDDRGGDLHSATADERLAFVDEADAVLRAFRALLDSQARTFGEGARRVAKLVPR